MSGRTGQFEFDWRGLTVGVAVMFDGEGRVTALGDVTLPWGPGRSARGLHDICGAIISADRYFRAPEMAGAAGSARLIPLGDIVQVLKPHGETAFVALMRVLAGAERDAMQAMSERRSAAFHSRLEGV